MLQKFQLIASFLSVFMFIPLWLTVRKRYSVKRDKKLIMILGIKIVLKLLEIILENLLLYDLCGILLNVVSLSIWVILEVGLILRFRKTIKEKNNNIIDVEFTDIE